MFLIKDIYFIVLEKLELKHLITKFWEAMKKKNITGDYETEIVGDLNLVSYIDICIMYIVKFA